MLLELADILWRGLRLRCPCCGHGHLFESATRVLKRCASCQELFEREPGQWFGAIYINLGLTVGFTVTGYLLLQTFTSLSTSQQINILTVGAVLGPFAFFRISKGLWISLIFLGEGLYIRWPNR